MRNALLLVDNKFKWMIYLNLDCSKFESNFNILNYGLKQNNFLLKLTF